MKVIHASFEQFAYLSLITFKEKRDMCNNIVNYQE